MARLSPETERKLLVVIEKTAEAVAAGATPNDALAKEAAVAELPQSAIPVVTHAYNVGRTAQQRQASDDPHVKAASFELANADVITEKLFPQLKKEASGHLQYSGPVSTDYLSGPGSWQQERARQQKVASLRPFPKIDAPVVAYPACVDAARLQQIDLQGLRRKEAEESRRQFRQAEDTARAAFCDLAEYFRRLDALPYSAVKQAATTLHGKAGQLIFDSAEEVFSFLRELPSYKKAGDADSLDCTQDPFPVIAAVLSTSREQNQKAAALQAAAEKYASVARRSDFEEPGGESIMATTFPTEKRAVNPLQSLGAYSLVSRALEDTAEKLAPPDDEARVSKLLGTLDDPEHESKLRAINSQAMLTDLMANDKVISGYGPEEVTDAYNNIVQISPSVGDQRMLMQTLLRQQLSQGVLDPFEQDRLLGYEDSLRKQNTPMGGGK